MPRRNIEIDPDQGRMFVTNEHTGSMVVQESLGVNPVANIENDPMIDTNPGPAVNILERNAHMQNMLRRLGVMSRTTGLQIASGTGLRRDLEARYDDVDRVVGNAAERSRKKHLEAKREFAEAFGLKAMIASGLVSEQDAKNMARESYNKEVLPTFADAKGASNRDAMKRHLNYQERTLKGKRTTKPKVALPKPPKVV